MVGVRAPAFTDGCRRPGRFALLPDTLTPLGIGPPIVRQWRPCVWVVIRRQTAGPHNLTHHNRVIAAIMHAVRRALHPGQRVIDQRRPAEWARGVRDVVELAEQISAAVGEVPGDCSWSTVSNDRHQFSASVIARWKRLDLLTQTKTRGGSKETEHTAVAVIACLIPR